MIFSDELMFSDDQDVAQSAGTYPSTNIIDTGVPGTVYGAAAALARNVGPGNKVPILVQMTEDLDSADDTATIQFQIETADEEEFDTTNVVVAMSREYTVAEAVAGMKWGVDCLPSDLKEFIRVNYIIGTQAATAGKVTAGITHGVDAG